MSHKLENNFVEEVLPQGNIMSGSPAWRFGMERKSLQRIWLWRPVRLDCRGFTGLRETAFTLGECTQVSWEKNINSNKITRKPKGSGKYLGLFWFSWFIFLTVCQLLYKLILLCSIFTEQHLYVRHPGYWRQPYSGTCIWWCWGYRHVHDELQYTVTALW